MNFLSYTIGLGAVDYEMVDSAVRKKPNMHCGSYKVYSDKDRFSIGKMQAFTVLHLQYENGRRHIRV